MSNKDCVEKLQGLRGMVDILPEQISVWQEIEALARHHFQRSVISEIRTPLLEATELFDRGIGETSDVVGKEMYSFLDRGSRNCTLRPEGTASVVRAAIQNGLINQGPKKLWYSGPMFRYERPQAGRQRQFHQIGLEFLGYADHRSDIEAISIAWDLLKDLGLKGLTLEINSLGNLEDRNVFRDQLIKWLQERINNLDQDSRDRISKNPLRILDSKNASTKALLQKAPKLSDSLGDESQERFEKVKLGLKALDIPFTINPLLVRGLDYYSHTAFEITSTQLGAQATVCGGGRYDGLVKQLGGPPTPSIGWAIGMERLVLLLQKTSQTFERQPQEIYIVNKGERAHQLALTITRKLRLKDKTVDLDLSDSAFSKQLKRADKNGFLWAIVIGDREADNGEVILKDLRAERSTTKDQIINLEALFERFT